MTSVNVTENKYSVSVTEGVTTVVTVKAPGAQGIQGIQGATGATGAGISAGDKGALTVAANLTDWTLNDSVVTNAKVNASAAIAGTKISPDFGSQNITTTGNAVFGGNLTVSGTTTTINTQTLDVEDINVTLGKVGSPTDITANNGGMSLLGDTTKTFQWLNATDSWTSSEHIALPDNKKLQLGDSQDLEIYHDSNNTFIKNNSGQLEISGPTNAVTSIAQIKLVDGEAVIRGKAGQNSVRCFANGSVELYHNNVKKAETTANGLNLPDNSKLQLGTGKDLQAYWDGSAGFITNQGGGNLHFNSDTVLIKNAANTKSYIRAYNNSSVELYHNNVKKFETTADGIDVTGTLKAINKVNIHDNGTSTPMLQLTNSVTGSGTEDGFRIGYSTNSNVAFFIAGESNSAFQIKTGGSAANDERLNISNTGVFTVKSNSENMLVATPNAGVELYHNNVKKLQTSTDGITVTDRVTCAAITISDGQPGLVFEDTGANPDFILQNRDGTFAIRDFTSNVNRFLVNMVNGELTTTGSILPDADNSDALGSSSKRFTTLHSAALNTGDINMSNLNDNGNEVDGSKGSWTLQEGADDLFIINRVSGKKYKFNLTEIS